MPDTETTIVETRPEHDAIAELIRTAVTDLAALTTPTHRLRAEAEIRVLFAALHAVDSVRYTVERSPGGFAWLVLDRWLPGRILESYATGPGGFERAVREATEQGRYNADDLAAELATTLDTHVGA